MPCSGCSTFESRFKKKYNNALILIVQNYGELYKIPSLIYLSWIANLQKYHVFQDRNESNECDRQLV